LEQVTVFRREYVDLVDGDVITALVLSQIVYWYLPSETGETKLRVWKPGDCGEKVWWIAKSHADWFTELGLTRKQASRCIEVLREKGIIHTRVFRFNGSPVVHLRLVHLLGKNIVSVAPAPEELLSGNLHSISNSPPLALQVQSITETTAQTTTQKVEAGKIPPIQVIVKVSSEMKAEEILKKKQEVVPTTLEGLWQSKLALFEGEEGKTTLPALGVKEKAQLKTLRLRVGEENIRPFLLWSIEHWMQFGDKAKSEKGLFNYPTVPLIGFLLAHHSVAHNLWLQSIAKKQEVVPVATVLLKEVQTPLPQEKHQTEGKHKLTLEELAALKAKIKS
jgi:hypothetical protein